MLQLLWVSSSLGLPLALGAAAGREVALVTRLEEDEVSGYEKANLCVTQFLQFQTHSEIALPELALAHSQ